MMSNWIRVPLGMLAGLLIYIVVSQAGDDRTLEMKISAEQATQEDIQKAKGYLAGFLETCPTLFNKFEDRIVEGPTIELKSPMPYREDTYGWPLEVEVSLVVAPDGGVASGHHVYYYLWDDVWLTQKHQGAEFCGRQGKAGRDTVVYTKGEPKSNAPIGVTIDPAEKAESEAIASKLGLSHGERYSYREWRLDTLERFRYHLPAIGDCGTWTEPKDCDRQARYEGVELIYCSHGKDRYGACVRPGDGPFLETYYLTEHDVTLLAEEHLTDEGSYFKLLQLAEGRQPDIYKN
ncbi:hypothetical protein Msub_11525 [Marinobacter subterrani]|uniref:Uncharacterized protein n=2 Tax=Marinobacter subterrani TaxID=1658765 RepID=A0A0J7JA43_9GAMM|nr:hypothetical protein Msub_11525 [Marinobacter subterrani]